MARDENSRYLWRDEARELSSPIRGVDGVLERRVVHRTVDGAHVFTLPVSPDFQSPRIDRNNGVDVSVPPWPPEVEIAERAISLAAAKETLAADTLARWARRMARALGGNNALARALLAIDGVPADPKSLPYKAQIRKVQEWQQGKYLRPGGVNERRVAQLRGSPGYAAGLALLEVQRVVAAIHGWWLISEKLYWRVLFTSDMAGDTQDEVKRIIAAGGEGLVDLLSMFQFENGQYAELQSLHGIALNLLATEG